MSWCDFESAIGARLQSSYDHGLPRWDCQILQERNWITDKSDSVSTLWRDFSQFLGVIFDMLLALFWHLMVPIFDQKTSASFTTCPKLETDRMRGMSPSQQKYGSTRNLIELVHNDFVVESRMDKFHVPNSSTCFQLNGQIVFVTSSGSRAPGWHFRESPFPPR
jgi:hypothetical protein